ncbi:hypothetical protein CSOJ01_14602 [Colletotrichum sojae]|uniref:Uncharacterized protein n=1 Tax=Colletotrichum sojae TaxID=2175907 RepID=A0A8H6MJ56_9PEZI|nr:hypothetical protein CSOJ01_14602 [Colletotrichum sojae]
MGGDPNGGPGTATTSHSDFDPSAKIKWRERVSHAIDGIVWKAEINGREYAVKVFWDNVAPEGYYYWAVQLECHNAALLEMMQSAIEQADEPFYLNPNPETRKHALLNLQAVSDEGCRKTS